jgi:DNA-binding SARP family transcriptional activator
LLIGKLVVMSLTLKLLGYPEVYLSGQRLKLPTQKLQAILYFLAVNKQASREELAELLWEPQARHRLRPELHRLRNLPEAERWLELDDTAVLHAQTDLDEFEEMVEEKSWQKALECYPENALLLQGFSVEDAPQFMAWLEEERRRVLGLYGDALRGRALELAAQQQFGEALDFVDCLIELDPLDESAYRLAMRLEYARGHLQAALQFFDTCRRVMAEELGLEPQEETLALAQEIQKGRALPAYQIRSRQRLPQTFLRPPLLIAREAEWERMEAAFQAGQAIFISGPAGTGKTRLMLDFARSKGDVVMAEGRIGDVHIPLSSSARLFRSYLETFPDRPLEPWVKEALSYLIERSSGAAHGEVNRTHVLEVFTAFFNHAAQHLRVFPTDNLHYFDPLSSELSSRSGFDFFIQKIPERCAINTFRPEGMNPEFFPILEHFIAEGIAVHIELQPLDVKAIGQLLASLELKDNNDLAAKLHHLTGGNPQFVIETLKSLHATGQLDNIPERIALPERLLYLLSKRLDGLSTPALRIAKAVATVEQTLSTDLLAELLELNAFDVAEAIAELEAVQVFVNNQFVHDLLQETAKQQTPAAVQRLLHKRMASLLERQTPDAARIAHHYLAADEREKALPWRLKAVEEAINTGFELQAGEWLEVLLFEAPEDSKTYAHALLLKGQLLLRKNVAQAEACFREGLEHSKYLFPELEASALAGLMQCEQYKQNTSLELTPTV